MGLIQEATEMVTRGIGLVGQEFLTWDDGSGHSHLQNTVLRRVVHSDGDVFFEVLHPSHNGQELMRFKDPAEAAYAFARFIGRSALSRAVAAHRYAFLFPSGSSLDWDRARDRTRRSRAA